MSETAEPMVGARLRTDRFVLRALTIASNLKKTLQKVKARKDRKQIEIIRAKRRTLQVLLAIFDQEIDNLDEAKKRLGL